MADDDLSLLFVISGDYKMVEIDINIDSYFLYIVNTGIFSGIKLLFTVKLFRTFGLYTDNTEAAIKQLNVKLRSHSNRIGFAAGRLNLVQGLY